MGKNANGEGSITYDKKRKRWRARISLEIPGGPQRKHLGLFKTRDEAHAALVEALSRRAGGADFRSTPTGSRLPNTSRTGWPTPPA